VVHLAQDLGLANTIPALVLRHIPSAVLNDHGAPLEVRGVLVRAWVAVLCREMLIPPAASTTIAALHQDTHNFFSCRCCWLRVAATSQREPIHRQ